MKWITSDTKKFLAEGYLEEGVTPEERIKYICDKAEEIGGQQGFSERFYEYCSQGWVSFSSPVWSNFGLSRGLPISCVTGDTWINTNNGGKMAKDIEIGDLVLTHKNRFKPVTNIIPTDKKDDIYKLKVGTRMTNLYITGNHPVLTNLGWIKVEDLKQGQHLIAVNGKIDYDDKEYKIDLKKYTNYKYILEDGCIKKAIETDIKKVLNKNLSETHITYYSKPKEFVKIDNDLAWCLGLWFAEGSLSINKDKNPNGIRITLNANDELGLAEKWLKIMSEKFNLNGKINKTDIVRNDKNNSWLNININGGIIGNFFKSFGSGCKNKEIPDYILNLPKDKLKSFLKGCLTGDGSPSGKGISITVANPKLLLGLYNIGLKLGEDMSLQMQTKAGKLATTTHTYTLIFRNYVNKISISSPNSGIKFNDGLIYCPIKTLEKTDKIEKVYDFTVADDHSFSCAGVVVHNCFASTTEDNTADLLWGLGETGMLTKIGGGTGRDFRNIRPRGAKISSGGESNGSISFMEMYDTMMSVVSQGNIRRGSLAVFLPIDHGDIKEFLEIKSTGSSIQNLSFGVSVPKGWMQEMIDGDTQKRKLWAKVLESRSEKGYPYIFFEDNVAEGRPQVYKDKDMDILHSNLCQEILEYTDSEKSFTCCLSSVNLLHYFEWKDTNFIKDMMYFLDCVLEDFIQRAEGMPFMEKVCKFAKEHRSVGLGVLGWHSLLQSKMIPFEGLESKLLNAEIFKYINEQSLEASRELAIEKGEPEILKGYGERFTTRIAIAPTTSSSFILGAVSPSIEPLASNYYIKGLAKGKFTYKNPILKDLLKTKDKDLPEVWDSILMKGGSVQHLGFLTQDEKNVFKTFSEVSQLEVIQQAAQRQQFIDQGQSLNLMIASNTSVKEINSLLIEAWKLGIKTLYYQRSTNAAQEVARSLMECASCEA